MGRGWWFVLVVVCGCQRAPVFHNKPPNGGFVVQCLAVTDFGKRLQPCNVPLHSGMGGCACAQGSLPEPSDLLGIPPLANHEPAGVVSFDDPLCTTTYNSTCLANVIPGSGHIDKVDLAPILFRAQITSGLLMEPTLQDVIDYVPTASNDEYSAIHRTAVDEVQRGCRLAHFGFLAEEIFGVRRPSIDWHTNTFNVGLDLNRYTSLLDTFDLRAGGWGRVMPPAGEQVSSYASHILSPAPFQTTSCQESLVYPFGDSSVLGFTEPGFVAHAPRPGTNVARLAPHQGVVLSNGSSGLLTVSGLAPQMLSLHGAIELELKDCISTGCPVVVRSLILSADPFVMEGYDVASVRVTSTNTVSGVLQGNTLAIASFSGEVQATLQDGRYDRVPVTAGVMLANWDPSARHFTMAFSFSSTLMDGTEVNINGTAFGPFDNISPTARIDVASPSTITSTAGTSKIECGGPDGTDVELTSAASTDAETTNLKSAWFRNGQRVASSENILLENLPLGAHVTQLLVYDERGATGEDRLTLDVVDTLPPDLSSDDVCVFPGNHRSVRFRLREELNVRAEDRCEGSLPTRISHVSSSAGVGVISWTDQDACLVIERSGQETTGRTYTITVEGADSRGNGATRQVHVLVPHDGPATGCLGTQHLEACP